jgi:O-methyltransferase
MSWYGDPMLIRMIKGLFASGPRPEEPPDPRSAMLLMQLEGFIKALQSGDPARVVYLAEAIFPASRNPVALSAVARAGRLDAAMKRYAEIAASGVDRRYASRAWEEVGYCHVLGGDVEEAVRAFDRAFRLQAGMEAGHAPFHDLYHRGMAVTQTWDSPRRRQRFLNLVGLVAQVTGLEGDCAECGCWRGLSSYLICSTLKQHDASYRGQGYHVFDSFQGLSQPTAADAGMNAQAGLFSATLEEVRRNLADFPDISFHPGWIPGSFSGLAERRYRFVHVDVDLHEPTDGAIRYFVPRLVPGGLLVCDDFNWPGARKAIEEFCRSSGISFSTTETNQAVIRA